MDIKYKNACKEVITLFEYFLDKEDFAKIPSKQIEHIKRCSNDDYNYVIDETKTLEEQEISKEAKALIISIYKSYFTDSEQKKKVDEIVSMLDEQKDMKEYRGYNSLEEAMQVKNADLKVEVKDNNPSEALVKTESIFKRIMNKILNFFGKK